MSKKLLKKLTYQVVCGKSRIDGPAMRLAAIVKDARQIQTQYGECFEFAGTFAATNMTTGETFEADRAFLPEVAESFLVSLLDAGRKIDGFASVDVVLDIQPLANEKSPVGYSFDVSVLNQVATKNPALEMLSAYAALPAPPQPA